MVTTNACLLTKEGKQIPLNDVSVFIDQLDLIAQVRIEQRYFNSETVPIEAHYKFPSPKGSTVYDFRSEINEKVVVAVVKEKEEARKEYSDAISRGDGAYLMEQDSGDIFSCSLGNIPAKTEVLLTITYVIEVPTEIDNTHLRLTIPTTVLPRYTPAIASEVASNKTAASRNTAANDITYTGEKPFVFSVRGNVKLNDGVKSINSKCSKINVTSLGAKSGKDASFEILDLEQLTNDLVISVTRGTPQTTAMTQDSATTENETGFNGVYRCATVVNVNPTFDEGTAVDESDLHWTLVIDRSGSMGHGKGSDMDNARIAAVRFVEEIPEKSSFDLYSFDNSFERFVGTEDGEKASIKHSGVTCDGCGQVPLAGTRNKCKSCADFDLCTTCLDKGFHKHHTFSQITTPMVRQLRKGYYGYNNGGYQNLTQLTASKGVTGIRSQAINWINKISSRGGTEFYPVMKDIYEKIQQNGKKVNNIIFISDGQSWNIEQLTTLIRGNSRLARVFTVGIGTSTSTATMQGMADAGLGRAEFVASGSDQLQEKVLSQFRRSRCPVSLENKLTVVTSGAYEMVPRTLPPIFKGDNTTVYVFSEAPVENVSYSEGDLEVSIELEHVNVEGMPLHRLAGSRYIDEVEFGKEGSALPHIQAVSGDSKKDRILQASLELNILSKYTSFIGVEERAGEEKTTEVAQVRNVPLQSKGYSNSDTLLVSCVSNGLHTLEMCSTPAIASFGASKGLRRGRRTKDIMSRGINTESSVSNYTSGNGVINAACDISLIDCECDEMGLSDEGAVYIDTPRVYTVPQILELFENEYRTEYTDTHWREAVARYNAAVSSGRVDLITRIVLLLQGLSGDTVKRLLSKLSGRYSFGEQSVLDALNISSPKTLSISV